MPLPDTAIEREQARALQLFAQLYCCREVQLLSMPPRAAAAANRSSSSRHRHQLRQPPLLAVIFQANLLF